MKKFAKVALWALLVATVCGTALASVEIIPIVSLSFDPSTCTYTYHIVCPAHITYPFGYFQVDAKVPCDGIFTSDWKLKGPSDLIKWANGVSTWEYGDTRNDDKDFAYWRASRRQEVMPSADGWSGDFVLTVPNTQPGPGSVMTKDGVVGSAKTHTCDVPCAVAIPEPSGLIGLGTSLMLVVGTLLRKRS